MKIYVLTICLLFSLFSLHAQKPVLQLDSYKNWPRVSDGGISNDGKYAFYQINNFPVSQNTFIVQATKGGFKKEFLNVSNACFSNNSRLLFGKLPNDTLIILDLYNGDQKKIAGVIRFELLDNSLKTLLLYENNAQNLNLCLMTGNIVLSLIDVKQYQSSKDGRFIITQHANSCETKGKERVNLIEVSTGKMKLIYEGNGASDFIFDDLNEQVSFIVRNEGGASIWYYKNGDEKAIQLVSERSVGIDSCLSIVRGRFFRFSKDRKRLFFSLKKKLRNEVKNVNLDIWSYQDSYLKSFYYENIVKGPETDYLSVVKISDGEIIQLLNGSERVEGDFNIRTDSLILIQSSFGPSNEKWNSSSRLTYFLCFTNTGDKIVIEKNRITPLDKIEISPSGKFIVYFDPETESYCSYMITSGRRYKLTESIPVAHFASYQMQNYPPTYIWPIGISGWLKDEENVIVQGDYDLWSLDLMNRKPPLNLTHGVGEKESIVFYLAEKSLGAYIGKNEKLLLSAFNVNTKEYGFYNLKLNGSRKLEKLSMGNRYSGQIKNVYTQLVSPDFIKAKHTSAYLIKWEDVNHAPNYFFSSDLNNYTVLSDVQPQVRYNWLKAELHSYKDSLGKLYQGVLYKPDNFDSSNTYPVIFNIYEEKSNLLNSFPNAAMSFGACSIAFLVSNGYLVFLPNIKKENPKYVGESVLRSVIAAADHLKKFKWIDQNKIGIIGESTGGFETNYIITHTNRFAAAISAAGVSDMISHATMLRYGNAHINSLSGYGYMMGATLPEDPSAYIRNSPILEADQVQTPLLLLHNFGDDAVDYRHSQSFFIVLRSLQKKVWWLNYKNEGHALLNFNDRLDYHTRAYEFWNYFLKNKKEPEWMREHLSAD